MRTRKRSARQRAASRRNLAKARAAKTGAGTTILKMVISKVADKGTGGVSGFLEDFSQGQVGQRRGRRKR